MRFTRLDSALEWAGAIMILATFLLLTIDAVSPKSILYLSLNAVGSLLLAYETWKKGDFPPMVLNVVWFFGALVAFVLLLV